MSSAPVMTSGMMGSRQSNLLGSMPSAGFHVPNAMAPLIFSPEPIAPKLMPNNIDVSTRRNVLPCKGIGHFVLRPEPPPAAAGMVPPQGNGRHLPAGLSQTRPTNLPLMKFSDPFSSGSNNPLGVPA